MKRLLATIIFAAVIVAACDDSPVGIFANIASEAAVRYSGSEAFRKATPGAIVQRDNTLYAVITKLWKKHGTKWELVTSNLPSNAVYANAAVVSGTMLYVSFLDANAKSLGVYSTSDDSTWTPIDTNFPANGEQLQQLLTANSKVFAVTSKKGADEKTEYVLYELTSGTFIQRKAGGTNLFYVVYNSSTYYVASGANVWASSDLSTFNESVTLSNNDYVTNLALIESKPTFTTAHGKIYWYDTAWKNTASLVVSSNELHLSTMVAIGPASSTGSNDLLLIATNAVARKVGTTTKISPASGYVEVSLPLATTSTQQAINALSTTNQSNFTSTIGSTALSALVLVTENSKPTLYAGSVGNGLWSNKYDGSSWSGWQRETD